MADVPTNPTMREYAFPSKHGASEADVCFRGKARRRKPSNPYRYGNVEAEWSKAGKTRKRFPGYVGIRRGGFP
ncbi:hypothetical protein DV729_24185 [Klebsiella pneumoniae]|nr:hypothetical protein [Klebsiella pneumoniae]